MKTEYQKIKQTITKLEMLLANAEAVEAKKPDKVWLLTIIDAARGCPFVRTLVFATEDLALRAMHNIAERDAKEINGCITNGEEITGATNDDSCCRVGYYDGLERWHYYIECINITTQME